MLPACLTPSPADLALCLPPFVLSLPWDLHSPRAPSASTCGWAAAQLQRGPMGAADVPGPARTYLNPTGRPWPSKQLPAEFELVCSECRWGFFLLKHPTVPLLPVCSLPSSWEAQWLVKQWLWHSSQPIPTLHSCSWLSELSFHHHQSVTIHLSCQWWFLFCVQGELGKHSEGSPKSKLCSTEKFSYHVLPLLNPALSCSILFHRSGL